MILAKSSNGQVIHHERVQAQSGICQCCFSGGTFYLQVIRQPGSSAIDILQFTPGTSTAFAAYVSRSTAVTSFAHDIVPVTNASTARVASAVNDGTNTTIKVFNSAGAQVGSTVTQAQNASVVSIDADQTDNTINLYAVTGGTSGTIRVYNLTTGAATLGPVATTAGASGAICRLPTLGANVQAIASVVNTTNDVAIQFFSQSALASLALFTLQRMGCRSRPVNAQSGTQKRAIAFAAIVAPAFPVLVSAVSGDTAAANALVYASPTTAHVAIRDFGQALDPTSLTFTPIMPNMSVDSSNGKLCWSSCASTRLLLGGSGGRQPLATLVDFLSPLRRQSARFGGLQYFAGWPVQCYDGRFPKELLFAEQPGIYSIAQSTGGSLVPGGIYTYAAHWEFTRADNSLEQGPITEIATVTMAALQTRNTLLISVPHSIVVALGANLFGGSLLLVLYRTAWDATTGTQVSSLFKCQVVQIPAGMANYGAPLSVPDGSDDTLLQKQGVIYTQAGRGDESGPLEHNAPEGCSYLAATESRMLDGGLVRPFEFQESKTAFLGEPFEYSVLPQFYGLVPEAVLGVAALSNARCVFTGNQILTFGSGGPDDVGAGGVPNPVRLPSASGLKSWTSFLVAPDGLYFQLDDNKIYQLPYGAYAPGTPAWVGVNVQDTLAAFPNVIGTALSRFDDTAVFAATTSSDARILTRSLRTGIWCEDTPPLTAGKGIEAMCAITPTVAYVSGGAVFVQSVSVFADSPGSTVIVTQWKSNPLYLFNIGGNGCADELLAVGEFRSAGTLAHCASSYDDGARRS